MTHGITATDSMFSVSSRRRRPWHGLGVVLDEYPRSIDEALDQTVPGRGWFPIFRFYGPLEPFFDKTWQLPDIQKTG